MRYFLLTLSLILITQPVYSKHLYMEKEYQQVWCNQKQGSLEYRLTDGTRVDCVTNTHAIEFDFASKWAESIGQSLYYGKTLNKKTGVVLIMENPQNDLRYLKRLQSIASTYDITIWTMTPDDMKKYVLVTNKK